MEAITSDGDPRTGPVLCVDGLMAKTETINGVPCYDLCILRECVYVLMCELFVLSEFSGLAKTLIEAHKTLLGNPAHSTCAVVHCVWNDSAAWLREDKDWD